MTHSFIEDLDIGRLRLLLVSPGADRRLWHLGAVGRDGHVWVFRLRSEAPISCLSLATPEAGRAWERLLHDAKRMHKMELSGHASGGIGGRHTQGTG